jgi:hypothetical protein
MLQANPVLRRVLALALVVAGCVTERPAGPVDAEDLFAQLHLELVAAWREGTTVVLDVQEQRDEAAVRVLDGFEAELVGEAVYLTPRYAGGTSGRRQRFRTQLAALGELPAGWNERLYLALDDRLQPLAAGAAWTGPVLRQRIVLGARILR